MKELIVLASITTKEGLKFVGTRHDECFKALFRAKISHIGSVCGFVTNKCRWLSREEALVFAKKSKQLKRDTTGNILISEDLW